MDDEEKTESEDVGIPDDAIAEALEVEVDEEDEIDPLSVADPFGGADDFDGKQWE